MWMGLDLLFALQQPLSTRWNHTNACDMAGPASFVFCGDGHIVYLVQVQKTFTNLAPGWLPVFGGETAPFGIPHLLNA
jgi:hypothetical protein